MDLRQNDALPCVTCHFYRPRNEFIAPACHAEPLSVYDPVKGREASDPATNRRQWPTCRWHVPRAETWLERNAANVFLTIALMIVAAWVAFDVAKHCGFPWQACGG